RAGQKPDDVKAAIIPFDTKVNVGASNISQTYVNFTLNNINSGTWNGCVIDRDKNYDVNDSPPVQGSSATLFPAATCSGLAQAMPLTTACAQLPARSDPTNPSGTANSTMGLWRSWHAPRTSQALPRPRV